MAKRRGKVALFEVVQKTGGLGTSGLGTSRSPFSRPEVKPKPPSLLQKLFKPADAPRASAPVAKEPAVRIKEGGMTAAERMAAMRAEMQADREPETVVEEAQRHAYEPPLISHGEEDTVPSLKPDDTHYAVASPSSAKPAMRLVPDQETDETIDLSPRAPKPKARGAACAIRQEEAEAAQHTTPLHSHERMPEKDLTPSVPLSEKLKAFTTPVASMARSSWEGVDLAGRTSALRDTIRRRDLGLVVQKYAVPGGIAAGFLVLGLLTFAVMRQSSGDNTASLPNSMLSGDQLRAGEAQPRVLDLGKGAPLTSDKLSSAETASAQTAAFSSGPRQAGLNYVIVQSYSTEADAIAASEVLRNYDVNSTVELNLPNWVQTGTTRYSVVSEMGFSRVKDVRELDNLIARIKDASKQELKKSIARPFDPQLYKWQSR
jgi:hypothetical protein